MLLPLSTRVNLDKSFSCSRLLIAIWVMRVTQNTRVFHNFPGWATPLNRWECPAGIFFGSVSVRLQELTLGRVTFNRAAVDGYGGEQGELL
jgi:hypothetical protein